MRFEIGKKYVLISVEGLNITKAKGLELDIEGADAFELDEEIKKVLIKKVCSDVEDFIENGLHVFIKIDNFTKKVKGYEIVEE